MKKLNFIYLLILPLVIFSCSIFEKFNYFGIGNTFEESFTVVVSEGNITSFEGSASFDASDDATLEDNIGNITEFKVTRISLRITKVAPASIMATGEVYITSEGDSIGNPVNMNIDLSSGEDIELDITPATFAAIEKAYLEKQKIKITAAGAVSDTPIDVEFTIYMSVEATIQS
ncbi:hypothetical protein MNBD_BACTEROID06-269 [hydrothermal vent metagenome]|uniref:Uncharacterized protein n=1 Tax=hydrothermal vent metagenome TaxID=652676 RepID=A0A3B0U7A7_9ZZZZ